MRLAIIAIIVIAIIALLYFVLKRSPDVEDVEIESMGNLVIKSSAFKNNDFIPARHTCDGDNVNPFIEILNAPAGTKSIALIMDDPDATGGVTWDHWILWNMEPKTHYIPEDSIPGNAILGTTSFGKTGYGGPCPPKGSKPHRYMFKVYALDSVLALNEGASKSELLKAMEGHVLDDGLLIGLYGRK